MGETVNPYQEVIAWLRSPEGELWSEQRIGGQGRTPVDYGHRGVAGDPLMVGMFSFEPTVTYEGGSSISPAGELIL
jgi:hypothetical protein